jgi:hypothetical protein
MFLLTSNVAKGTVLLLGALIGAIPMVSPVMILLWGLCLDVFGVLSILYTVPQKYIFSLRPGRYQLPRFGRESLYPLATGVLFGVLTILAPLVSAALGGNAASAGSGAIWIAVCFGAIALSVEQMQDESMFHARGRLSRPMAALSFLAVAGVIAVMFSGSFAGFLGGARPDWVTALWALVPPVVTVAACEVYKKIQHSDVE